MHASHMCAVGQGIQFSCHGRYCYAEVMFFGLQPGSEIVRVGTNVNYVYEHIGHEVSTMTNWA